MKISSYYSRRILLYLFGINLWHQSRLEERDYAMYIVDSFRNTRLDIVCDIGCGLAEISSNLIATKRILIDNSVNIRIFLIITNFHKILRSKLRVMKKFEAKIIAPNAQAMVIMLNFSHNLPWNDVKKILTQLNLKMSPNTQLIIDTVSNPAYQHDHYLDLKNYSEKEGLMLKLLFEGQSNRNVWCLQVSQ